jgi:hypothetical protein
MGMDTGTPVSEDYHVPFKFTGELKKVVIEPGKNGLAASDERDTRCEIRDAETRSGIRDTRYLKSRITHPASRISHLSLGGKIEL